MMMNKCSLISRWGYGLILLACGVLPSLAQSPAKGPVTEMTLKQCVDYALQHSPKVLMLKQRSEMTDLNLHSAKMAFSPSFNAGVGGSMSFGRSQDKTGIYRDNSAGSTSFNIGGSLSIFEGGARIYALKQAQLDKSSEGYVIADTKDRTALSIVNLYVNVLASKGIYQVALDKLSLTEQNLANLKTKVKVGREAESRLPEMEAQKSRDELSVTQAYGDLRRAQKELLLEMGISDRDSITLLAPRRANNPIEVRGEQIMMEPSIWKMSAIHLAEIDLQKAEYNLKMAYAQYWPSLSLSAGYNNGYYYNFDKNLRAFNPSFSDQMRSNGRSYIGVNVSIPLFNQGQRSAQVKRASIQLDQLRHQLAERQIEDTKNRELARMDLDKARDQMAMAAKNQSYANTALRVATIEYEAGRLNLYDFESAKNRVAEAKATLIRATYDYILKSLILHYFNTGEIDYSLMQ